MIGAKWFGKTQIVVPFDFSEQATEAVTLATRLTVDDRLVSVLHVIPDIHKIYPSYAETFFDDDERIEDAKKKMAEHLREVGALITCAALVGDPGHVIIDFAKAADCGLIVIPSHGRTGISRVLLGSVAERVVRHANCPVLVLK